MLTPAPTRGRTGSTGPMDRTCVSTGRSPETSGPSSPECTDPQRWRPSRRQPRHERGVLVHGYQAAGRHAMVVAHFFESGQRRRLRWGRVESAPLMAGAVALASTELRDRRKAWGPRRLARASRVPHSVSRHSPRRQLESRVREAQVESSFWSGGWIAAQLRPPGTGC